MLCPHYQLYVVLAVPPLSLSTLKKERQCFIFKMFSFNFIMKAKLTFSEVPLLSSYLVFMDTFNFGTKEH